MPTLREYLTQSSGSFTSPNHPVQMSGQEVINTLRGDVGIIPGYTAFDIDPLELEIEAVEQESGDRWLYPVDRALLHEAGPLFIHHP